jgi:hypothetical protein
MAKILTFRPGEMRRDDSDFASAESTAEASAEVIVFPGVRYERWDETGESQSQLQPEGKKRSRNRHRDVLELAE